jgi:hypothetical protein
VRLHEIFRWPFGQVAFAVLRLSVLNFFVTQA